MIGFLSDNDDFYVNLNLNTQLDLPSARETVLHYFEQMRKGFPGELTNFFTRENGDLVLEGDKEKDSYRWVSLESKRVCSGHVNPETLEEAYRQHEVVLEMAPYLLSLSTLDCEALDVMYGFDLTYSGNHDEVVAEALGLGSAFENVLEPSDGHRIMNFEPSITLALDPSLHMQCRLSIETRTNPFQVRSGDFTEEQLSVYFAVRKYWSGSETSFLDSFRQQRLVGEDLLLNRVIPRVIRPLAQAIASR